MTAKNFTYLFLLIALLELASNFFIDSLPIFHYVTKPLIMIVLSWYYWREMREQFKGMIVLMQVALLFSWMGDVLLMGNGDLFFMLGLGSFLLSQLGYAMVFGSEGSGFLKQKPYWVLPFLIVGAVLIYLVWPGLGDMKIPVVVYAMAILSMAIMALNRKGSVSEKSFTWVLIGAMLFVLSDSLIALNKFAFDIPLSKTWIMLSYMAAQYLIVMGFIAGRKPGAS